MKRIIDLPLHDRPREKLLAKGASSLSDQELMAAILGKGTRSQDVLSLAAAVIKRLDRGGAIASAAQLCETAGIGPAKAAMICAALEFARRRIRPEGQRIERPGDTYSLVRHFAGRKQEHLLCISLTGAREVIAVRVATVGLVNTMHIHPREVFADPITDRAASVIVAHNHPTGPIAPSRDDTEVTVMLKTAGEILGISLLDHVIFGARHYFSFLEHGLI